MLKPGVLHKAKWIAQEQMRQILATLGITTGTSGGIDASAITSGTIDAARLPSYVDDVVEVANYAALPVTGETGKIYITLDTGFSYRWSGSVYILFSATKGSPSTLYAYTGTYASLPAASGYAAGTQARVTDIGPSGSIFYSDGVSRWLPVNGRCTLGILPIPVGLAPTFTGSTDGAIIFGTAVPVKFDKCFVYYPANSIVASHAAGFYYTEMSSTTAAIVYNNTYTPAVGAYPTAPASKTAFAGAVPGGTGTGVDVTIFKVKLPAGILGLNGAIITDIIGEANNGSGKYIKPALNSTDTGAFYLSSNTSGHVIHAIKNVTAVLQRCAGNAQNIPFSTVFSSIAEDTRIDATINYIMLKSASDNIFCSSLITEVVVAS